MSSIFKAIKSICQLKLNTELVVNILALVGFRSGCSCPSILRLTPSNQLSRQTLILSGHWRPITPETHCDEFMRSTLYVCFISPDFVIIRRDVDIGVFSLLTPLLARRHTYTAASSTWPRHSRGANWSVIITFFQTDSKETLSTENYQNLLLSQTVYYSHTITANTA